MKRVLITGIGGSIGVNVYAHIMQKTDWEVVGIDSFRHKGWYERLVEVTKEFPEWNKRLDVITHDLTADLTHGQKKRIGKIDHIINLASLCDVWDSVADPVPFCRNNHELMLTMLELAREIKPTTFLHFSTDEVYGPTEPDQKWAEWSPLVPSNPYAASKAAQEMLAISYWRTYGLPLIITNTVNNFAEMQSRTKYPVIVQNKLEAGEKLTIHTDGDGNIGSRYYIHSRNAADAVLFILDNCPPYAHVPGKVDKPDRYNITSDTRIDNLTLAQTIARLMNKELEYETVNFHASEPGHDLHYGLDHTKLENLGWTPPVSLEDSLKSTIKWQERHKDWIESEKS